MGDERTFTVDEANRALPELRERLQRIRTARQTILRAAERIRGQVATDGGGQEGTDYWEARASVKADIERLAEQGILLRDPETGLVDFPGEREGHRVYLCWRMGEDRVSHWHDVDSGFAGRKPL
ncbi:MAG: DUF2203 domain-containing protein [Actinomycetota bacterium]